MVKEAHKTAYNYVNMVVSGMTETRKRQQGYDSSGLRSLDSA